VTATIDESLLGWSLPVDDPAGAARTADGLLAAADRLSALGRRLGAMVPVQRWSGVASAAADQRLALTAVALGLEHRRMLRAADALTRFSRQVAVARMLADEASLLIAAARAAQRAADLTDPGGTGQRSGGWGGYRADGALYDPHAVALLDRARERAYDARTSYDRAARQLAAELTELSGRRVVRAGMSARTWLDLAGFVPVLGDAVDGVNAAVYFAQGRWREGLLTSAAVVPGPGGWAAGGAKIGKALDHAGDIVKVVDDVPAERRVADVVAGLTERGRRPENRVLPDDDSIASLYWTTLEPLGTTEVKHGTLGDVLVTTLPGGGMVSFRRESRCGGAAIQFVRITGIDVGRIHRRDC
jgi:hypothetical protein